MHFGQQVLVPDLAASRRSRVPDLPRAPFIELAPDWVCEVLSPTTAMVDGARKMRHYVRPEPFDAVDLDLSGLWAA